MTRWVLCQSGDEALALLEGPNGTRAAVLIRPRRPPVALDAAAARRWLQERGYWSAAGGAAW